jgi:hypothetical protein
MPVSIDTEPEAELRPVNFAEPMISQNITQLLDVPLDVNHQGLYTDLDGQTIHFTAGTNNEDNSSQNFHRQINDLNLYSHHYLGAFCESAANVEEFSHDCDDDATLSNVAAVLNISGLSLYKPLMRQ